MTDNNKDTTCGDCGVPEGEYHDFWCDMERCPVCGEQILYCGCTTDEIRNAGRYPHIEYPLMCGKCGQLWPKFFMVSNEEWEYYIEPTRRDLVLCRSCYDYICAVTESETEAEATSGI